MDERARAEAVNTQPSRIVEMAVGMVGLRNMKCRPCPQAVAKVKLWPTGVRGIAQDGRLDRQGATQRAAVEAKNREVALHRTPPDHRLAHHHRGIIDIARGGHRTAAAVSVCHQCHAEKRGAHEDAGSLLPFPVFADDRCCHDGHARKAEPCP